MQKWLPRINLQRCTTCGLCVAHCPTKAVQIVDSHPVFTNEDACTYCGICEDICPVEAISLIYEISKGEYPNNI